MKREILSLFAVLIIVLAIMGVTLDSHAQEGPILPSATATLKWDAVINDYLAGYRVYRGVGVEQCNNLAPLAPLLINGAPAFVASTSTTFFDPNIPATEGPVCYEVTAYNVADLESPHSNRAQAVLLTNPPSVPQHLEFVIP